MAEHPLSIIIPAAGSSQRLGQAKQLVQFSGKPLLQASIELATTLQPLEIIVVTGAAADKIQPVIATMNRHHHQMTMIHNPNWETGMGSSIAAGMAVVNRNTKGVMILLADQWKLSPDDLFSIQSRWQSDPDSLVVSSAANFHGPPVIFPRDCFASLAKLNGERGASKVISDNLHRSVYVEVPHASVDLDTPEDLRELLIDEDLK